MLQKKMKECKEIWNTGGAAYNFRSSGQGQLIEKESLALAVPRRKASRNTGQSRHSKEPQVGATGHFGRRAPFWCGWSRAGEGGQGEVWRGCGN